MSNGFNTLTTLKNILYRIDFTRENKEWFWLYDTLSFVSGHVSPFNAKVSIYSGTQLQLILNRHPDNVYIHNYTGLGRHQSLVHAMAAVSFRTFPHLVYVLRKQIDKKKSN